MPVAHSPVFVAIRHPPDAWHAKPRCAPQSARCRHADAGRKPNGAFVQPRDGSLQPSAVDFPSRDGVRRRCDNGSFHDDGRLKARNIPFETRATLPAPRAMEVLPRTRPDGRVEGRGQEGDGPHRRAAEEGESTMSESETLKWKTEETIRCGLAVHELAVTHREELEPRVGAATIDGLGTDVAELRNDAAGAVSSRADRRSSTLDQNEALRTGAAVVAAVRSAIRHVHPADKALQGEFGVGVAVNDRSVPSVAAGLQIVLDASARHPDETRAAGILDADIEKAQNARAGLATADATQEGRKLGAREATARRRATQLRVQKGIDRILAAATLAFVDRPSLLAKFTSLVPSRPRRAPKDPTATGTTPTSPT
jgi:hypothetical protein